MKHALLLAWLICSLFKQGLAQEGKSSAFFWETSMQFVEGGDRMLGLGLVAGWQATPAFGMGIGLDYQFSYYHSLLFSASFRGFVPKPGWSRLYYSIKGGIGPILNLRDPEEYGRTALGEIMLGYRFTPSLIVGWGYTLWRSREYPQPFNPFLPYYLRKDRGFSLHVKAAFGRSRPDWETGNRLYGYAIFSPVGIGPVSYPHMDKGPIQDATAFLGVGYTLNKNWGIGLGFTGLDILNREYHHRMIRGMGVHGLYTWKALIAMAELGYAPDVVDGYNSGASTWYTFTPNTLESSIGYAPYYRLTAGVRFWEHLLVTGSVLGTFPAWGEEDYGGGWVGPRTIGTTRRALFSWQIGIGYIVGLP